MGSSPSSATNSFFKTKKRKAFPMHGKSSSLGLKVGVVASIILVFIIGGIFLANISYENTEQRLRADVEDQQRKIEANLDKMWKTISQKVQILDKYSDDFKQIAVGYVQGRYGDGGSKAMFQWLKEHNVNISTKLYEEMMVTIEAERKDFERQQRYLSELAAEHKKLYVTAPSSWFVEGRPVEIKIISSTKTKQIIETGEENEINLFK